MTLDIWVTIFYFSIVLIIGLTISNQVKTMSDYTTGNRNYSAFVIFATLSSAFIGGGFTSGLAEKVFSTGIIYILVMWGFSVKEILVATLIAPRMTIFKDAISVGDIMGMLYGKGAKVFTGLASLLVCGGIAGAQFGAFGYMLEILIDIPPFLGVMIGASIVIVYASLGGMKAVVANDILHFCVLMIALPLVLIFGLYHRGDPSFILQNLPSSHLALFESIPPLAALSLFLSFFFGETLVPPYVQRLLIGKNFKETAKGTLWSGLLSFAFFILIGFIGLIALQLNPNLNPNLALPFVIQSVMPAGLKGLAISGMIAVLMSSADAFLNSAGIALSRDVIGVLRPKPLDNKTELLISRFATLVVGLTAVFFALRISSVLDILLYAYNFWTPFILVPLVAGILGYRLTPQAFWTSSLFGISSTLLWNFFCRNSLDLDIEGTLIGIIVNLIIFITFLCIEKYAFNLPQQSVTR
jgi:SSS family solute:Na+ symporter